MGLNEALKRGRKELYVWDHELPALARLPQEEASQFLSVTVCSRERRLPIFPQCVLRLKNLERLVISSHAINAIPEAIQELEHLKVLDLSDNNLTSVSEAVSRLSKLMVLGLKDNALIFLPSALYGLPELQSVTIAGNNDLTLSPLPQEKRMADRMALLFKRQTTEITPQFEAAAGVRAFCNHCAKQCAEFANNHAGSHCREYFCKYAFRDGLFLSETFFENSDGECELLDSRTICTFEEVEAGFRSHLRVNWRGRLQASCTIAYTAPETCEAYEETVPFSEIVQRHASDHWSQFEWLPV
jgi:Leucine-rich repeat (LRR) protein